jgi:hypothetical protein
VRLFSLAGRLSPGRESHSNTTLHISLAILYTKYTGRRQNVRLQRLRLGTLSSALELSISPWIGVLLGLSRIVALYELYHLLFHFTPESLTYSVPLFLNRQCDRILGALRPLRPQAAAHRGGAGARSRGYESNSVILTRVTPPCRYISLAIIYTRYTGWRQNDSNVYT